MRNHSHRHCICRQRLSSGPRQQRPHPKSNQNHITQRLDPIPFVGKSNTHITVPPVTLLTYLPNSPILLYMPSAPKSTLRWDEDATTFSPKQRGFQGPQKVECVHRNTVVFYLNSGLQASSFRLQIHQRAPSSAPVYFSSAQTSILIMHLYPAHTADTAPDVPPAMPRRASPREPVLPAFPGRLPLHHWHADGLL